MSAHRIVQYQSNIDTEFPSGESGRRLLTKGIKL